MANDEMTMGIDEAGRGPILGSMVLAVVCLTEKQSHKLQMLGVADSKNFGSGPKAHLRRSELAKIVYKEASHVRTIDAEVKEVDRRVKDKELNQLERDMATTLIESAPKVDKIIADGETLFSPLKKQFPYLVAMNKAESAYTAVAAASIVAKDRRDFLFSLIVKRYSEQFGPVRGGGYVNKATKEFIMKHHHALGCLPPETRLSWPSPLSV